MRRKFSPAIYKKNWMGIQSSTHGRGVKKEARLSSGFNGLSFGRSRKDVRATAVALVVVFATEPEPFAL